MIVPDLVISVRNAVFFHFIHILPSIIFMFTEIQLFYIANSRYMWQISHKCNKTRINDTYLRFMIYQQSYAIYLPTFPQTAEFTDCT